ncbi:hypothetical protein AC1031_012927 [Aphanomyces cochlioides]|nr:hypothetical protein AC1031_012927 [Aphanomyces cochlioides]
MAAAATCVFNQCNKEAITASGKCAFHKHRVKCGIADCSNQAVMDNKCVRHGGKRLCRVNGCEQHARSGHFCAKHGGVSYKRFCTHEGCTKQAHVNKKCIAHGGRRYCSHADCTRHARVNGLCQQHQSASVALLSDDAVTIKIDMSILDSIMGSLPDSTALELEHFALRGLLNTAPVML